MRKLTVGLQQMVESLENRLLMASVNSTPLHVQVDYTYDTTNFFNTPAKRDLMQSAADFAVARLGDSLSSIIPSGDNAWRAVFDHPATGIEQRAQNLSVPADTLLVYVGSRTLSDAVAIGGPGGYSATGSSSWLDRVGSRGQDNARGQNATDFGPWGGSITFDPNPDGGWFFGMDGEARGADSNDFYSVAIHETLHVLGFGTSDSFSHFVLNGKFTGPAAQAEYDAGGPVPLSAERSHWADGTTDSGQEAAMDPTISAGQVKLPTPLDYAALDDIGWQLPISVALNNAGPFVRDSATAEVMIDYSHYRALLDSRIAQAGVTITGPGGYSTPATLVRLAPAVGDGHTRTAVYSFAAPGGTWDSGDSGQYAVQLTAAIADNFNNTSGTGQAAVFTAAVEGPPSATLNAPTVTEFGGAAATISVDYSDDSAVDAATIDASDLTLVRSDGLALTIIGQPVLSPNGSASRVTAMYTVAAPGGSWDPSDNGLYTVTLGASQVADDLGGFAVGGALGSLRVAVGLIEFGGKTVATYTDASGDLVTLSLKGPGTGSVVLQGNQPADAQLISLSGVTAQTAFTIAVRGAGTSVGGISIDGALRSISAKAVDLVGNLDAVGSIGKAQFRNAANGTWTVGDGLAMTLTLAEVSEVSLTSTGAVKSIAANNWLDADASGETISAPFIGALKLRGNLSAAVDAGSLGKVTIGGALAGAALRASGSIAAITVGALTNGAILAGVSAAAEGLPSQADFTDPAAQIRSLSIKSKTPGSFAGVVAAPIIAKASLGAAIVNRGGTPFGLVAGQIRAVSGITDAAGKYKFANASDPQDLLTLSDLVLRVV